MRFRNELRIYLLFGETKRSGVEQKQGELNAELESRAMGGAKVGIWSQIRGGAQLKKVEQNNKPVSKPGRDALLDQIRSGIQLKTVRAPISCVSVLM